MEARRDSRLSKENGNTFRVFSTVKEQSEASSTTMYHSRTPLADVKNKHSKNSTGSSRKLSFDSCISLDIVNQDLTDTPKRQESKSKSRNRKSCFAVFDLPENMDACENKAVGVTLPRTIEEEPENFMLQSQMLSRAVGVTLPRTIEEEPENRTLQSQMLSRTVGVTLPRTIEEEPENLTLQNQMLSGDIISEWSTKTTKFKADQSLCETFTASASQLYISVGEGNEFGLVCGRTATCLAVADKTEQNDAEVDDVCQSVMSCSPEMKSDSDNSEAPATGLMHSPVVSFVETETDKLMGLLVGECATNLSQNFDALATDSEMELPDMAQGPTYSRVSIVKSIISQFEAAENSVSNSACFNTSEVLDIGREFQERQLCTTEEVHNWSACHSFSTPLSSPLGLMNISSSSFKEELQKTDLTDLIKSYLLNLNNSCTSAEELSFSTPAGGNICNVNLSSSTDQCDSKHMFISYKSLSETNIPELPVTDTHSDQDVGTVVTQRENIKICLLDSEKGETELKTYLNDDVNILDNGSVMFIPSKDGQNSRVPVSAALTSPLQDSGNQQSLCMNQNIHLAELSCKIQSPILSVNSESFNVESAVHEQTALSGEAVVHEQSELSRETVVHEQTELSGETEIREETTVFGERFMHEHTTVGEANALVYIRLDISDTDKQSLECEKNDRSELFDYPRIVTLPAHKTVDHERDVLLTIDHCQVEVMSISTNTSVLEQADVSVLTDHQHGLVDTSMVTDISHGTDVCYGIDVSMVTDCVGMIDNGVMAMPEFQTQETMTETKTMIDTESAMTPLRLAKNAKRLTAEEIRRQHPRIVANQLEVLMASNQRLEKEVDTVTHDRDRLKLALADARSKQTVADKQLNEEKTRQGEVISVIEKYHHKAVEGLEACVKDKQDRVDHLEAELKEIRLKYENTQEEAKSSKLEWQEKYAKLETHNREAEQHFAEEIRKLQSQFEEKSYEHAFLASQQVIKELQAEKEEFAGLIEDIEKSALLQIKLQDSLLLLITKSQKAVGDYVAMYERLVKENQAMYQQYTSLQTDLEVALSENRDLHEDIQNVNDILKRSSDNYAMLEGMYQDVKQDLSNSLTQAAELNNKIEFGFKIVKDLMKAKADLTVELSEHQENNSLLSENLKSATEKLSILQQQLESERQLATASDDNYGKMIAEYQSSKSKLELTVENLRSTLDSWDLERDVQEHELNTYLEEIDIQRLKISEMSKELQVLRQIKATTQSEKNYIKELRNTNQFLEAEKQLYLEAVTDYRTRLEAEIELSASNNALLDALRSNNTEQQQSNDQLLSDIQIMEEALSLKTMDLDMSWTAMENLQEKMESVLTSLQQKFNIEVKQGKSSKEKFVVPRTPSTSFHKGSSLVVQVLSAAKGRPAPQPRSPNTIHSFERVSELHSSSSNLDFGSCSGAEKTKLRQSNLQCGIETEGLLTPHSQSSNASSQVTGTTTFSKRSFSILKTFQGSETNPEILLECKAGKSSARKDISKLYPEQELNTYTPGYAKICSIPSTMDRTLEGMTRSRSDMRSAGMMNSSLDENSCPDSESMLATVNVVDRLFSLILKAVDMADRTAVLTIKDFQDDIDLLQEKLKTQRCHASDRETDLTQKSAQLIAANSQIKDLNARVNGMTQSLLNFQDQQYQIMRLEEDKADLNRKIRGLREEVTLLSGQLEEVIQKMDDAKSGQKSDSTYVKEIIILKKKNHELIMKLFDEREKNKEVGDKAMRRMKILESNWSKAEAEVGRFDELVENIREACVRSQAQLTHPVILRVVRLIDGVTEQPCLEPSDRTPHKSSI